MTAFFHLSRHLKKPIKEYEMRSGQRLKTINLVRRKNKNKKSL